MIYIRTSVVDISDGVFDVTEFGGINLGQLWDTKYLGSPLFFGILLGIKQFLTNMVVVMG